MPGDVIPSYPIGVMPKSLCTLYTESRGYEQLQTAYHDGTIERSQLAQTSRKSWKLAQKLTAAQLATLKAFYDSANGGLARFWFYDLFAVCPVGSNYDPTGANPVGRYTVVFRNDWLESTNILRTDVPSLSLFEVGEGAGMEAIGGGLGPFDTVGWEFTVWAQRTPNNQDGLVHGTAWESFDGGSFHIGSVIPTGPTLTSSTTSISSSTNLATLVLGAEIVYSGGTLHLGDPTVSPFYTPEMWLIYDAYVTIPLVAGGVVRFRAAWWAVNQPGINVGRIVDGNLGNDRDTTPPGTPTTCAKLQRWLFSNLTHDPIWAIGNFTVPV